MKLWDVPAELVMSIASDAISMYLELLDRPDYTRAEAEAMAICEVVEGAQVNHDALDAEARAASVQGGMADDLPF